ncbi:MAG: hypothetical protein ACI9DJ_000399 [Algoriphagus sp.]|jgi:hypothetical protein
MGTEVVINLFVDVFHLVELKKSIDVSQSTLEITTKALMT